LPAGSYLVKVTVNGKVVGTKTVTIEADNLY
jgi:outer membrane usher protein FimD/PapC